MAVAFDAKFASASGAAGDTVEGTGVTSISTTKLTIGGSATFLVVFCAWHLNATARSATWNGVSMTEALSSEHSFTRSSIFILVNPATGNHTLAISWTTSCDVYVGAASFTGTDTSTGYNSADNATVTTDDPVTVTVTSTTDGATVAMENTNGNFPTMNFTQIFKDNPLSHGAGGSYTLGGTSNGHTFSGQGGNDTNSIGIHIIAGSGGGVTVKTLAALGVG